MIKVTLPISELILNADGSVYHLNLLPQDIGKHIITVGDPERVKMISDKFDSVHLKKAHREFVTHTGKYKGVEITVISTGIGTDNIDIVINELDALVNVDLKNRTVKDNPVSLNIYRVGTSGTIQNNIALGAILISKAAVGLDGLLPFYGMGVKDNHPFTQALQKEFEGKLPQCFYTEASEKLLTHFTKDKTFITGTTLTMAGFYAPQGRCIRYSHPIPKMMEILSDFSFENEKLTNIEMETSGIYGLSKILGHHAISINAILANRITGEFTNSVEEVVNRAIDLTLDNIVELEG